MKRILSLAVALVIWAAQVTIAQEGNREEIRIRVEKEENGKRTITEKIIDTKGMTPEQRQRLVEKVQDSLGTVGSSQRIKVTIEDNSTVERWNESGDLSEGRNGNVRIYKYHRQADPAWKDQFQRGMGDFETQMRFWGEELPRRMESLPPLQRFEQRIGDKVQPSAMQIISVTPNKPQSNILTVRMNTTAEGDVTIRVLDVEGRTVATERLNKFTGDYVGQITLPRNSKGTYFVIASQNGDGVSRRVVVE